MRYFYDEPTFYKVFKISRQEFVERLEKAKDANKVEQILDLVYKAEA
jgi:hypothetical protein